MKNLKIMFVLLIGCLIFTSCDNIEYPRYTLESIDYVPDSLKTEHREWITEAIRAASQQMTGGDYEDVDDTIEQAKITADELFQRTIVGMRIEINDNYYDDLHLKPNQLNVKHKKEFEKLQNYE